MFTIGITQNQKIVTKGFEGSLLSPLMKLQHQRQAYYDGSFIENHAHSMSFEGELIAIGIKI